MTSIYSYLGSLETILDGIDASNLTNLTVVPSFLKDSFETLSNPYNLIMSNPHVSNLGGTTKYYKNERATIIGTLQSDDLSSSRDTIELNNREILTEYDRLIQANNQSDIMVSEILINYDDLISWEPVRIEFIMTREGISL